MEKRPSTAVKIATLLSSLMLVGGCVSYRAGILDDTKTQASKLAEPETKSTSPSSDGKVGTDSPTASAPAPDDKKTEPAVFYGTKAPLSVITSPTTPP